MAEQRKTWRWAIVIAVILLATAGCLMWAQLGAPDTMHWPLSNNSKAMDEEVRRRLMELEVRAASERERQRQASMERRRAEEAERVAAQRVALEAETNRQNEAARLEREEAARRAGSIPDFPWPPPKASAWAVIPNELITIIGQPSPTLAAVSQQLERALDSAAYHQRSFFKLPNGFAMVTQLEKINSDGTPITEQRWLSADSSAGFSLEGYLRRLLYADPGRYRLVVFAVTDIPFSTSGEAMTARDASRMVSKGVNILPQTISTDLYSPQHRCTALVYEFRKTTAPQPELVAPSPLPGRDHLVKARMWAAFENAARKP